MRKTVLALVIALIVVSFVGFTILFTASDLGNGRGYGAQTSTSSISSNRLLWDLLAAIPLIAALLVLVYELLFPPIKSTNPTPATTATTPAENPPPFTASPEPIEQTPTPPVTTPVAPEKAYTLEAILRVLDEDERKVVEAIAASEEGFMLQRDIRWKAGLNRVQTHRVLARLSARGIVTVEKYYNTNKVTLASWATNNQPK